MEVLEKLRFHSITRFQFKTYKEGVNKHIEKDRTMVLYFVYKEALCLFMVTRNINVIRNMLF